LSSLAAPLAVDLLGGDARLSRWRAARTGWERGLLLELDRKSQALEFRQAERTRLARGSSREPGHFSD
jgi:hypothetical protein